MQNFVQGITAWIVFAEQLSADYAAVGILAARVGNPEARERRIEGVDLSDRGSFIRLAFTLDLEPDSYCFRLCNFPEDPEGEPQEIFRELVKVTAPA